MLLFSYLPFIGTALSLLLAAASLARRKPSIATWAFCFGMLALGIDSAVTGVGLRAAPEQLEMWLAIGAVAKSVVPGIWLLFSVTYSRGDYPETLRRWGVALLVIALTPIVLTIAFRSELYEILRPIDGSAQIAVKAGPVARLLNVFFLICFILVLMNVEQTFRSAVGTSRWQIKFVVIALAVIFGARIYVKTQAMLYSAPDITQWSVNSGGLVVGSVLLGVAYVRTGLAEIDVYPSLAVLRSSITVMLVGGYLLTVGVLAQAVRRFGGAESFQLQAFVVLLGVAGLAVLMLSDRARQRLNLLAARHFKKAQHDSVHIWSLFSQRLANITDEGTLCAAAAKSISETFNVLSVTVWMIDPETGRLRLVASTRPQSSRGSDGESSGERADVAAALRLRTNPFDLENTQQRWAQEWRELNPATFPNGGHRWCIPLRTENQFVGAIVLADRVSGALYSVEEIELLKCIADQITSAALNVRLGAEVANARELEAFRTMSAFFVHDLKNAASSLNLMLKNLPLHFDDPAFRADALRGVGNSARRIEEMIARLSALRQRPVSSEHPVDVADVVREVLDRIEPGAGVELTRDLQPVAKVVCDRAQVQSVVTNLVLNARDALPHGGAIRVSTEQRNRRALIVVQDNGSGMTPEFLNGRLFRPFQSTKKSGLGIGLFQCRAIVHAHGGTITAESEVGRGTTFTVSLPVSDPS